MVLFAEGAVADWSANYLRFDAGATAALAALGYGSFSLAMTTARLSGGSVIERFGPASVARLGAGLASVGLAVGLVLRVPLAGTIGFAALGLGLGNLIPILFTAAGQQPQAHVADAIARVASAG